MAVKGQVHAKDPSGQTAFMVDADGLVQPVSADNPVPVQFVDAETVELTGDVVVDTFGALDDTKVTNPDAASASIPALLRGILSILTDIKTLQTAANGLLTDIKTNTTP